MDNFFTGGLDSLARLSDAESRSISPENYNGAKGKGGMSKIGEGSSSRAARDLGEGWKVNPLVVIEPGAVFEMANIDGPGCINHIWLTASGKWREWIIRFYWDSQEHPSVEAPLGDFFANGWNEYARVNSLPICVNPGSAFNCYWKMPFKKKCKITVENRSTEKQVIYYQVDYVMTPLPDDIAYFHARFKRTNPLPYKEAYTIIDGVKGRGHYVGTYMAWGVNNNGWWGEGEIKFFIDGDKKYPTICGTGTEDYFCGSYNFENQADKRYEEFNSAYAGLPQVIRPDGLYRSQTRFGLYRWHLTDPIYFKKDINVTIQALGWRSGGRYLPLQDDISSVAYWYQSLPSAKFPEFPGVDYCEIQ